MIWILVAIIVIAIYNAEKIPDLIEKFKHEVPQIVETGKKVSKGLKEKAHTSMPTSKKEKSKTKDEEK